MENLYRVYRNFTTIPAYWNCDGTHSQQWLSQSTNVHCYRTFALGSSEMVFIYHRENMRCIGKGHWQFLCLTWHVFHNVLYLWRSLCIPVFFVSLRNMSYQYPRDIHLLWNQEKTTRCQGVYEIEPVAIVQLSLLKPFLSFFPGINDIKFHSIWHFDLFHID